MPLFCILPTWREGLEPATRGPAGEKLPRDVGSFGGGGGPRGNRRCPRETERSEVGAWFEAVARSKGQ